MAQSLTNRPESGAGVQLLRSANALVIRGKNKNRAGRSPLRAYQFHLKELRARQYSAELTDTERSCSS